MEFHPLSNFYLLLSFSILFLSSSFSLANAKVSFTYCDKRAYAVKVSGIEISPNPVVSGTPATFKISASSEKGISGGEVVIGVSYVGIPVHTERIDLCKESSCPIPNGKFVLSHTQTLPAITPPGPYSLKLTLTDNAGELLTCIKFNFKIVLWSVVADI